MPSPRPASQHRPEMAEATSGVHRLPEPRAGLAEMSAAIDMVLQPVGDLRTGRVAGAEALARFRLVPSRTPDLWFAEAWESGFGVELECAAIRTALRHLATMPPSTYLALNVSPTTLIDPLLEEVLADAPAERIVLELTEHARVDDYEPLGQAVKKARARGARLAVDDAGAGFASFQHILQLRPDFIKLDRMLTRGIDSDPAKHALASALVAFASKLGAQICAEGIETPSELATLQELGVPFGQGYLLGRPGPGPLGERIPGAWSVPLVSARVEDALDELADQALWPGRDLASLSDPVRLAVLRDTGLMDSPEEEVFDRFTRLASRVLDAPIALVTLVDDRRVFIKSAAGMGKLEASRGETPLRESFCQHVVTTKRPLVVSDAHTHPLTRETPGVAARSIGAYLGVPLAGSDAIVLGAVCAAGPEPRSWSPKDLDTLRQIASALMTEIELRGTLKQLRKSEERYRTLVRNLPNSSVVVFDHHLRFLIADGDQLFEAIGLTRGAIEGRTLDEVASPENLPALQATYRATLTGTSGHLEMRRNGRWLAIHTAPTKDDRGAISGGMVMTYDITALKTAETELRAQTATVHLLGDIASAANKATTSADAFRYALARVSEHTGWSVGHVFLVEAGALVSQDIWFLADAARTGPFCEATERTRFTLGAGLIGEVAKTGQATWMLDVGRSPGFLRQEGARAAGLTMGLAFPVLAGDEVAGVLEFYTSVERAPDAAVLSVMAHVGEQLGRLVERERHAALVRGLSLHDELTCLLNRRGFLELGGCEYAGARRDGRPLGVLYADLNGMKSINDELGHEHGDAALRDMAAVLSTVFPAPDLVARLGGDEFVVLVREGDPDAIALRMGRVREAVASFNRRRQRPYKLSVSLGMAAFDVAAPAPLERLLAEADEHMYDQKRARRLSGRMTIPVPPTE